MLEKKLSEGLQALSLNLPAKAQHQLLDYLSLLKKWNQVYNLTAIRDLEQMVTYHLLDSLTVFPYLQGIHLLDVGTGGGLPGLVLAIANPQHHWTLLDKSAKKIRFIKQAVIELHLTNVEPVCVNIELFKPLTLFDTIISRAYTRLSHFHQQTARFCNPSGRLLAMKGSYPTEELLEIQELSITMQCLPLQVPQLPVQRHLVILQL